MKGFGKHHTTTMNSKVHALLSTLSENRYPHNWERVFSKLGTRRISKVSRVRPRTCDVYFENIIN